MAQAEASRRGRYLHFAAAWACVLTGLVYVWGGVGWSFIAEWTGAQVSSLLEEVGAAGGARYVFFFTFDDWNESIDMADAVHPQTLLAYGMNGRDLPLDHGAPARLKVPRQLGYKNLKYLTRILVTDTVKDVGDALGGSAAEVGYSWDAGI